MQIAQLSPHTYALEEGSCKKCQECAKKVGKMENRKVYWLHIPFYILHLGN